ncbi:DUF1444 family protein [Flavobacterium sp. 3-218]
MFFKKKPLSETEFSKKFAKGLLKRVNGLQIISINGLEIIAKFNGISDFKHFLDNCYAEYKIDPKDIKDILNRYLNAASAIYLPKEVLKSERILPVIKDKRFVASLREMNVDFEESHVFESYNEELFIFYVEDGEHTINYISQSNLKEINLSIDNLKSIALENLKNCIKIERHGENGFYMVTAGGNYESSLILLNIWDNENFPINGNFLIGIPTRDILYVTGSKDSENLHKLYDYIEKMNEKGSHLVSDKIFELKGGIFEVL